MDSATYRSYMQWLYPIERAVCAAWPSLLAFQFVILGEPIAANTLSVPLSHASERQEETQLA
jgi:hypothetical protein